MSSLPPVLRNSLNYTSNYTSPLPIRHCAPHHYLFVRIFSGLSLKREKKYDMERVHRARRHLEVWRIILCDTRSKLLLYNKYYLVHPPLSPIGHTTNTTIIHSKPLYLPSQWMGRTKTWDGQSGCKNTKFRCNPFIPAPPPPSKIFPQLSCF